MKDKEVLEFCFELAEERGIKDKYLVEYVHSSTLLSKDDALDAYKHANMKCCDNVRLYKINSVDDVKLIKEK